MSFLQEFYKYGMECAADDFHKWMVDNNQQDDEQPAGAPSKYKSAAEIVVEKVQNKLAAKKGGKDKELKAKEYTRRWGEGLGGGHKATSMRDRLARLRKRKGLAKTAGLLHPETVGGAKTLGLLKRLGVGGAVGGGLGVLTGHGDQFLGDDSTRGRNALIGAALGAGGLAATGGLSSRVVDELYRDINVTRNLSKGHLSNARISQQLKHPVSFYHDPVPPSPLTERAYLDALTKIMPTKSEGFLKRLEEIDREVKLNLKDAEKFKAASLGL